MFLRRLPLVFALLMLACASGGSSGGEEAKQPNFHPEACGAHGLYALPAMPERGVEAHSAIKAAVDAFGRAEASFARDDRAKAWREFLEAARHLSEVPAGNRLSDWAKYARELAYHDALWAAAAAGQLVESKGLLEKTAESDPALAEQIRSMLADSPVECSQH
ncbi:MAG: hypothetical protein IPI67_28265 [Myxococcales bacterium]|nr:hypothetical protein [Myxococcales bacterium]